MIIAELIKALKKYRPSTEVKIQISTDPEEFNIAEIEGVKLTTVTYSEDPGGNVLAKQRCVVLKAEEQLQ